MKVRILDVIRMVIENIRCRLSDVLDPNYFYLSF